MRIDELKVGMMVTREEWSESAEVRFMENERVVCRHADGRYSVCYENDGWIEEKKKPSEIVADALHGKPIIVPNNCSLAESAHWANSRIDKILEYLDQQAEVKP